MLQESPSSNSKHKANGNARSKRKPEAMAQPAPCPELVPLLVSVAKQTRAIINHMLLEIDMVAGPDQLLLALEPGKTKIVSVLADELSIRASTVSKTVDRLIKKGLLTHSPDPSDNRKVHIGLTSAGVDFQASVQAVLARFEQDLHQGLGHEVEETVVALGKLNEVVTARFRRLR